MKLQKSIWSDFVFERRTVNQLARDHNKSVNWVRKQLEGYKLPRKDVLPHKTVVVADATFFKRLYGVLVLRADKTKKNIFWRIIDSERIEAYARARKKIENQGFEISALVSDGRPGVRGVFGDVPCQMCHFHQRQIIIRHLTTKPKLQAGIELKKIAETLSKTTEEKFAEMLDLWHKKWQLFLKEMTYNPETKRKFYTHRRIRSAHYSLRKNLPYLFTYQKYPELNIPTTTNSLEGCFSHLKELIKIHRGLSCKLKRKMIDEILSK